MVIAQEDGIQFLQSLCNLTPLFSYHLRLKRKRALRHHQHNLQVLVLHTQWFFQLLYRLKKWRLLQPDQRSKRALLSTQLNLSRPALWMSCLVQKAIWSQQLLQRPSWTTCWENTWKGKGRRHNRNSRCFRFRLWFRLGFFVMYIWTWIPPTRSWWIEDTWYTLFSGYDFIFRRRFALRICLALILRFCLGFSSFRLWLLWIRCHRCCRFIFFIFLTFVFLLLFVFLVVLFLVCWIWLPWGSINFDLQGGKNGNSILITLRFINDFNHGLPKELKWSLRRSDGCFTIFINP